MTDQLGALLKQLRRRAGLTQEQVAERSGVSVRTIRRLETGKSADHRLGTVHLLADALEVSPEDRHRLATSLAGTRAAATADPADTPLEAAGPALTDTPAPVPLDRPDDTVTEATPSPAPASAPFAAPPEAPAPPEAQAPSAASGAPPAEAAPASRPAPVSSPTPAPYPVPEPFLAPGPVPGELGEAVRVLASEIRRRWRREEEQRQVHDPYPLPVRWQPAPAGLTDRPENVQRLGPGAAPVELDLSGDLRGVAEVYRRISSGRLVVLGRAGSGKSILTIRFALDLLESRPAGPGTARVPVIFSLGAWDPTTTALRDWLTDRLLRDHPHLARRGPGGTTLAAALIDADLVLPVLDGFDELAEGLRRDALEALNATSMPLVLTSRRAEYAEAVRAAHAPLVWAAGIELTDLSLDTLAGYLPRTARAVAPEQAAAPRASVWDGVLAQLRTGGTPAREHLAAVLTTPLMVILARTMYSDAPDRDPAELLDLDRFPTVRAVEEHLLAGFVPTVYRPRPAGAAVGRGAAPGRARVWGPDRAQLWLGHLADHLTRLDRERQDLAWWQIGDSLRLPVRVLAVVLGTALCVALADWLISPLVYESGAGEVFLQGSLMGPVAGLAFGAVYAVLAAYGGGAVFEPARVQLRLPRPPAGDDGAVGRTDRTVGGISGAVGWIGRRAGRTFAARFATGLLGGVVMGVGCACALLLERWIYLGVPLTDPAVLKGTAIDMLCFGLVFGLAAGLIFGLVAVLETPVDTTSAATPTSLLAANRATVGRQLLVMTPLLTLAIAFGGRLVIDLLQGPLGPLYWTVPDGLFIGVVAGLGGGAAYVLAFTAWGQWLLFGRFWLPLTGRLPWATVAFLDDAYRRGVLRRTGAVYQFRHIRLQHHLGHRYRTRRPNYRPASFDPAEPAPPAPPA